MIALWAWGHSQPQPACSAGHPWLARRRSLALFAQCGQRRDLPDELRPQCPGQVVAHAREPREASSMPLAATRPAVRAATSPMSAVWHAISTPVTSAVRQRPRSLRPASAGETAVRADEPWWSSDLADDISTNCASPISPAKTAQDRPQDKAAQIVLPSCRGRKAGQMPGGMVHAPGPLDEILDCLAYAQAVHQGADESAGRVRRPSSASGRACGRHGAPPRLARLIPDEAERQGP